MKGLLLNIYSCGFSDSLSPMKEAKMCVLIGENIAKIFEPSTENPAVRIVKRVIFGKEYIHAEPYEKGNYSFGGRYIASSDSRFSEINNYPIPLHDRNMNLEIR